MYIDSTVIATVARKMYWFFSPVTSAISLYMTDTIVTFSAKIDPKHQSRKLIVNFKPLWTPRGIVKSNLHSRHKCAPSVSSVFVILEPLFLQQFSFNLVVLSITSLWSPK